MNKVIKDAKFTSLVFWWLFEYNSAFGAYIHGTQAYLPLTIWANARMIPSKPLNV